jgi:hypothetical protein
LATRVAGNQAQQPKTHRIAQGFEHRGQLDGLGLV